MAQQLKERIDKWKYRKLKIFWTAKKMVTKLKIQSTERDVIFGSFTSHKGLITREYRVLKKNPKLTKNQWSTTEIGKWTEQSFFKRRSTNTQKTWNAYHPWPSNPH
jgi:hypothetical protein